MQAIVPLRLAIAVQTVFNEFFQLLINDVGRSAGKRGRPLAALRRLFDGSLPSQLASVSPLLGCINVLDPRFRLEM